MRMSLKYLFMKHLSLRLATVSALATLSALAALAISPSLATAGTILFIGNDGATPGIFTPTDTAMFNRLTGVLGHTVTMMDDNNVAAPGLAAAMDMIIISNTASSGAVANVWGTIPGTDNDGSNLRAYGHPILNFQGGTNVVVPMGLIGNTAPAIGNGTFTNDSMNILLPAHPLAAGLSGLLPVVTGAPGTVPFSSFGTESGATLGRKIVADADIVGTYFTAALGGHQLGGIVALELGDALGNPLADANYIAAAPSRRVNLFLEKTTFDVLNADGLKLFDAAVGYTMAGPKVPEPSTVVLTGLALLGLVARRVVRREK